MKLIVNFFSLMLFLCSKKVFAIEVLAFDKVAALPGLSSSFLPPFFPPFLSSGFFISLVSSLSLSNR
jgi:hypothetical protein